MAEETKTEAPEAAPAEEVVVAEVAAAEKEVVDEPPPPPAPEPEPAPEVQKPTKNPALEVALAAEAAAEAEEKKAAAQEAEAAAKAATILQAVSFKEESNLASDLDDPEKKALEELKQLVQAALANNEFSPPPPPPPQPAPAAAAPTSAEEPPFKAEEAKAVEEPAATPVEEPHKAVAEEAKAEAEPAATLVEEPQKAVVEEAKAEAEPAATPVEEPQKAVAKEAKAEEEPAATPIEEPQKAMAEESAPPAKEEEAEKPAPASAYPTAEKAVVVDDDGAKTVEAIEETVVPVAAPPPAETEAPAAEAPKAEKEEEKSPAPPTEPTPPAPEEVFIWGVPLLGDERSDTVLLKFLRARDFKVKEAMAMLKNAVLWRKEFGIEALLEEDLGVLEMEKVVFMHGVDKEGHPVCYNVYGEFQNKELYAAAFADEEKRKRFLRWRIQYLEKGIRNLLDFKPEGVSTMVQVTDLKNSIGLAKKELRQALDLLQDNYPEFAAKQVFINVPWWYLAFNRMISPFFTQRTKSKFVFAGPSKSAETLFKYIAPEQVPVQFGGLSKENDTDFSTADAVIETTIKPSTKQAIEIPVTESCILVWELRVLGWDVNYRAEFVPRAEDGYTVIVQKSRKMVVTDEPVVKDSFKIGEAGKVVLTVDNTTSKKKKLLYRYKTKSSSDSI
ncbi:patellin-3-like [Musa acuminata AAA Group]|uniref:patellin-3-like n=1 Tax=Musa acuminata AAA Group TaxID=214697 RepID=UPI0031DDEDE5